MDDAERLTDLWVELAKGQREHGSQLLAEGNRAPIEALIKRHIVSDRLRTVRLDAQIIGFVMFEVESGSLQRDVDRGIIENLYVAPDSRRQGVGSALLEAAESALREVGVSVVTLDVIAENEAARSFYRERGYAPHRITVAKSIESDTHSKGDD